MSLNVMIPADGTGYTALGLPLGGGTLTVTNPSTLAPVFATADGTPIVLSGGYPVTGSIGWFISGGYSANVRVDPALPNDVPTLRVKRLGGATAGTARVQPANGAPDPKPYVFAAIPAATVTSINVDGLLGRNTGPIDACVVTGPFSVSGDDITPDQNGTGCVYVDGQDGAVSVTVTRTVNGIPTVRVYAAAATVVALAPH